VAELACLLCCGDQLGLGGVVVGSGGQKLIGDRDPSGDGRQ
jgi:hypothetical protein